MKWDGGGLPDGKYVVSVSAADSLLEVTQRVLVQIDRAPPTLRLLSLAPITLRVSEPGTLVIGTIAVVAFVLVLLGAPGLFRPLVTYQIYFDNAVGIKQGAPVMLAGRKIGQVQKLFSPVTPQEEKQAEEAEAAIRRSEASPTPAATPGRRLGRRRG